jgi:putative transcriptional regulator
MRSTTGRLLVASPLLGDPNFERSVVLMVEHDAESALGLVLTNPTQTRVADMLPRWSRLLTSPDVFFLGGPVSYESVICLGRSAMNDPDFPKLVGDVGVVDLNEDPDTYPVPLDEIRVFAGYSGWGSGQLEGELAQDAWFVVDAHPGDAFYQQPDDLWSAVLGRQTGPMSWLANYPTDPSVN